MGRFFLRTIPSPCKHTVEVDQVMGLRYLEPLAAELLGGSVGGVGPLDGDTVVVGVLKR